MLTILLLVVGFALLIAGAEVLVRGASRLAVAFGISPLVVGLTVVSLGTSSPEIAVSLQSALEGNGDLVMGNVVGSNICNVLLILGSAALVLPLIVSQRLIRIDVPIMVGAAVVVILLAANGSLGRTDGLLLVVAFAGYLAFTFYAGRVGEPLEVEADAGDKSRGATAAYAGMIVAGLVLLAIGARLLVDSATEIATDLGVSTLIIGLTLVALGTSLPEIATSLIAALRGQRDLAVGNVVGSNIANVLGVLGISALISPDAIGVSPGALRFDLPVMLAVAIACLPIFFTGRLIARWEGGLFLAYYGAYLLYLILESTEHDALGPYSTAMLWFVIPITVFTLAGLALRELHSLRQRRARRRTQ